MKRIVAAGAMALAFAFQFAAPTMASAQRQDSGSAQDAVAWCEELVANFPQLGISVGECVGNFRSDFESRYSHFCHILDDQERLQEINGSTSVGECIRFLKSQVIEM
jgi:hypothetical protein